MHESIDTELVALACADDTEAFRLLLERYQPMAFAIALHQVSVPEVAQDLVQEAMLQAYLSLDQLRDPTRFKSWFYGIVLNVCRNWQRRHAVRFLSLESWDEYQPIVADPSDVVEEHELRCAVQQAVQGLSAKNRIAMFLFYYENLSLEEIAMRLDLSLPRISGKEDCTYASLIQAEQRLMRSASRQRSREPRTGHGMKHRSMSRPTAPSFSSASAWWE